MGRILRQWRGLALRLGAWAVGLLVFGSVVALGDRSGIAGVIGTAAVLGAVALLYALAGLLAAVGVAWALRRLRT